MQHLLSLKDVSGKWMKETVALGISIKKSMRGKNGGIDTAKFRSSPYKDALEGKRLAVIFEKPSLRTRFSFGFGIQALGGFLVDADSKGMHLGTSDLRAEARSLAGLADIIMIRPLKHATVAQIAQWSSVPVINGLSESDHPCQALADIMTIDEQFGKFDGIKVAYLGIANNVSNSLSLACVESGATFVLCTPAGEKGRDPDAKDEALMRRLRATKRYFEISDVAKAVEGAHILYTDTWVNMEHLSNEELMRARKKLLVPYQLNRKALELAGTQAWVMHDLPAHTNPPMEITPDVLHGSRSIAFMQAENRMWAQMAVMMKLLGEG